ncbi:MAG: hypothetical protein UT09_C0019G0015 [Parcubacteria group bacterium GW2011_GWF2_38_8]|nr:MAG: hypothetical protein UT09_C0019G0015 [Parcubacteria group bacterium GW2011_GWF2_38_8]
MRKTVKKISQKYVTEKTFERHMQSIAKSFADNAEVMALILKEIRTMHEENKYFRASISNLNIDGLSYDRKIENLTVRMEKVESKLK